MSSFNLSRKISQSNLPQPEDAKYIGTTIRVKDGHPFFQTVIRSHYNSIEEFDSNSPTSWVLEFNSIRDFIKDTRIKSLIIEGESIKYTQGL